MNINDSDSIILLTASNLVRMRSPGQGLTQVALVETTIKTFKLLKEALKKEQE